VVETLAWPSHFWTLAMSASCESAQRFTVETMVDNYERVYAELIEKAANKPHDRRRGESLRAVG
jgi:hypothetical protein